MPVNIFPVPTCAAGRFVIRFSQFSRVRACTRGESQFSQKEVGGLSPVARVAVEKTTCRFDKLFDYAIPEGMVLTAGVRVMVPFGRGGRRVGLVVALADVPESNTPLKPVAAVLEEEPVLTEEGLFLLRWLRENTFCTWFDALSVLIPAGYGLRGLIGWSLVRGVPLPEALSPPE